MHPGNHTLIFSNSHSGSLLRINVAESSSRYSRIKQANAKIVIWGSVPTSWDFLVGRKSFCSRFSHTESTGGSFPMALTAMTAKDWRDSLDFSTQEVSDKSVWDNWSRKAGWGAKRYERCCCALQKAQRSNRMGRVGGGPGVKKKTFVRLNI